MTNEMQPQFDVPQLVLEAAERCRDHLSPTPLEYSMYLSKQIDGEVWLKLDSMQRTSSFKFRGALNKILTLTEEELEQGVVTASTGNYALAMAALVGPADADDAAGQPADLPERSPQHVAQTSDRHRSEKASF